MASGQTDYQAAVMLESYVLLLAAVLWIQATVLQSVLQMLSAAAAVAVAVSAVAAVAVSAAAAVVVSAASDSDVAEQKSPLPLLLLSDWQAASSAWRSTVTLCQLTDWMAASFLASPRLTELSPAAGPQICVHALRASSSVQSPRHRLTAWEDLTA